MIEDEEEIGARFVGIGLKIIRLCRIRVLVDHVLHSRQLQLIEPRGIISPSGHCTSTRMSLQGLRYSQHTASQPRLCSVILQQERTDSQLVCSPGFLRKGVLKECLVVRAQMLRKRLPKVFLIESDQLPSTGSCAMATAV